MLVRGFNRAFRRTPNRAAVFDPRRVFAPGDLGAWYDPSDLLTLFQDSLGTPVTTAGQPIGLMLDKRYGLALGINRITNGDFGAGSASWTLTSASVADGALNCSGGGYVNFGRQDVVIEPGVYEFSFSVSNYQSGSVGLNVTAENSASSNGNFKFTRVVSSTLYFLFIQSLSSGFIGNIDNVSVRKISGSHAVQTTTTARPAYRTAPSRVDYDGIDDVLVTTFASSLGANCTILRAVPNVGAVILTGQTIGTTYSDNQDHCGLLIINRALTASETAQITNYFNAKSF